MFADLLSERGSGDSNALRVEEMQPVFREGDFVRQGYGLIVRGFHDRDVSERGQKSQAPLLPGWLSPCHCLALFVTANRSARKAYRDFCANVLQFRFQIFVRQDKSLQGVSYVAAPRLDDPGGDIFQASRFDF